MNNDLSLILKAASFAADKHRNQSRKGVEATPYINHPLEVARILAEEGGVTDAELLAAALLHDTIEDTETSTEELRAHFGDRVTDLVLEVTDNKGLAKDVRKRLQIEYAPYKSPGAALIKAADKIANVRDVIERPPAHWGLVRRVDYVGWAERVVEGLPNVTEVLRALFEVEFRRARDQLSTQGR